MTQPILAAVILPLLLAPQGGEGAGASPEPRAGARLAILVTNDDGASAPGIVALARALAKVADVTVVAPAKQQSGTSHAHSRGPFEVRAVPSADGIPWWAADARPATCVRVGLDHVLKAPPDLVVAGINSGSNAGLGTYSSGTVAAAREAAMAGLPAIAFSLVGGDDADAEAAAQLATRLVVRLHERGEIRPGLFLNVNFPAGTRNGVAGEAVTRLDVGRLPVDLVRTGAGTGRESFVLEPRRGTAPPAERGSDQEALGRGLVSITPLGLDPTVAGRIRPLARSVAGAFAPPAGYGSQQPSKKSSR